MATQVVKVETSTAIAKAEAEAQGGNPFEDYADYVSPKHIVGELLKFSKGDYCAGEGDETIPAGTLVVPVMDTLLAGYIRWEDGRPTDHAMVRVADGKRPPRRGDLGDHDKTLWERDERGELRDPWQWGNYLVMIQLENARLFTFTTGSRGGRDAISDLSRRFANHQRHRPKDFPIIMLSVESYMHRIREYGRIKYPSFKPAGYLDSNKYNDLLVRASLIDPGAGALETSSKKLPPAEFGAEATEDPAAGMAGVRSEDEIPF